MAPGDETALEPDSLDTIFSDKPATAEPETREQPRDEAGRFAAKEEPKADLQPEPDPKPQPEAKIEQPADHRIPLAEHLSEREKRQAAERRAEELEMQLRRFSQRQQQPRQPEKPIDLLENPEGFSASLESRIERRILARYLDSSFEDAREQHGEAFDKAYGALLRAVDEGDLGLRDRIVNSGNPGRTLIRWHQQQEALREIGGDLQGYRKKLLSDEAFRKDALSDAEFKKFVMSHPDFRKEAMEAWRAEAGQSQQSNVTSLPPRLSSAPAARVVEPSNGGTDEERFENVWATRR